MKYRYVLTRDDSKNKLTISEFARGVDEHLSIMGSREVDGEAIQAALSQGKMAVVDILRTHGMYPPEHVAMDMVDLVNQLYGPNREEVKEGYVDEIDVIVEEVFKAEEVDESDDDDVDDDMPEEDILESDDLDLGDSSDDSADSADDNDDDSDDDVLD
ncbi:hypothetical protein [Desulfatibacillum aliphaticivorans]|uniref:Uncharacterized protein n=1 Tax=Desulfatibacillum aliphaticivorans TaxID=218208 RepID=B8FAF7_DESAL|nr:hypothetical protein [Desulfatibacillum aliphaticivorans]ACL03253.1 hypothetical protein Dalk_1555 [Desulfatibacillum aliphaticivorans]